MKTYISYSKGSNSGSAIYIGYIDEKGYGTGHRIAGSKCWGYINDLNTWYLDENDLERIEKEIKYLRRQLKKEDSKILRLLNKSLKKDLEKNESR